MQEFVENFKNSFQNHKNGIWIGVGIAGIGSGIYFGGKFLSNSFKNRRLNSILEESNRKRKLNHKQFETSIGNLNEKSIEKYRKILELNAQELIGRKLKKFLNKIFIQIC